MLAQISSAAVAANTRGMPPERCAPSTGSIEPELLASTALSGIRKSPRGIQDIGSHASAFRCGYWDHRPNGATARDFAVWALIDLGASEAIRNRLPPGCGLYLIVGDIEDVETALGLRAGRAAPAPNDTSLSTDGFPWLHRKSAQQHARASPPSTATGISGSDGNGSRPESLGTIAPTED